MILYEERQVKAMGISTLGAYSGGYGYYNFYNYNTPGLKGQAAGEEDDKKIGETEMKRSFGSHECKTCENRRYQDKSSDSGVSMQSPTKVDPKSAEAAVRAHEYQHVSRNKAKADRNDREVVSQSVSIKRTICPECGKSVVSGGETRTVTKEADKNNPYNVGLFDEQKGTFFDTAA